MSSLDAPMKTLNDGALAAGGRRFRFVPLRDRLRAASARPAALPPLPPSSSAAAADTGFTHFADALAARRELDLTAAFCDYADDVAPLALSLPLVFTARERIVKRTLEALSPGTAAAHSLTDCLCAVARDIGPEHFYPFLSAVVQTLAQLFGADEAETGGEGRAKGSGDDPNNGSREGDREKKASSAVAAAASQLWDPDRTLVPAFAALARIVKLLVQPLLRAPEAAIEALSPLLAHPHYRVREMAAEASAGYMLRKTRDPVALVALCDAVLCLPAMVPSTSANSAADGTSAVFYEGTRAIRGGVHPFAEQIWTHTIDAALRCNAEDVQFMAVANALAAVRQNTSTEDAVACISVCLLRCAEREAKSSDHEGKPAIGNALFLLRCWCAHGTGARMKEVHQQRALDVAVAVTATAAASDDRAICEALGIISALLVALSGSVGAIRYRALNKSARASLVSATQNVPVKLTSVALQTLRVACEARALSASEVLPPYAALCDRVADSNDSAALEHALLLLRRLSLPMSSPVSVAPVQLANFEAPKLCAAVLQSIHGNCEESGSSHRKALALEFCRLAMVSGSADVLTKFIQRWETTKSRDSSEIALVALAVDALVAQHFLKAQDAAWEQVTQRLLESSLSLLVKAPNQLGPVRALNRLLMFPLLSITKLIGEELITATAKCLSSGSRELRCQASFLLKQVASTKITNGSSRRDERDRGDKGDESDIDDDDGEGIAARLSLRLETECSLASVFEVIWGIFSAPLTVEDSAATQQLVSSLASIPQRPVELARSQSLRIVLSHTAVGLFRTKFKLLWKGAGDLWSSVAMEDSKLAWTPLLDVLILSRDSILQSCAHRANSLEADNEEGEDAEDGPGEEISKGHGAGDIEGGVDSSASQGGANSRSDDSRAGSKRKCPDPERGEPCGDSELPDVDIDGAQPIKEQTPLKRVRRSQTKGVVHLRWIPSSWQSQIQEARNATVSHAVLNILRDEANDDSTDSVTIHREMLIAIGRKPSVAYDQRPTIVRELYLRLDSEMMSRRLANSLVRVYTDLLERLGGLKCTGNDSVLEQRMRARLMKDLCRPEAPCQTAVVKCLAVSRSPEMKAHRDSLLRLIDDSTFRDELANLSTRLQESGDMGSDAKSAADNGLQDVLVRICFGKMRGRRVRLGSRRGAVLGFIVATLSWSEAIPRLVRLSIAPIEKDVLDLVEFMENSPSDDLNDKECRVAAPANVMRGILRSMEAIVQQFGVAIPIESWRRLACAACVMLEATNSASAKTIRALTLRRLSAMVDKRPRETEFIVRRVVAVVRRGRFDSSSADDVTDAPGLLVFLASCARANFSHSHEMLVREEAWVCKWSLSVVAGARARLNAVDLALDVARLLVDQMAKDIGPDAEQGSPKDGMLDEALVALVPMALHHRLNMFRDLMSREGKLGRWRVVLEKTMNIVSVLGDCGLADAQALALVSSLSSFVVADAGRCQEATKGTLVALGGLFRHLCGHSCRGATATERALPEAFVTSNVMSLSRLLNDKFVAGNFEEREALCRAIHCLNRRDLEVVADCLSDMGAMRRDRVQKADYDTRLGSLSNLCKAVKKALDERSEIRLSRRTDVGSGVDEASEFITLESDGLCALMRGCLWALKDEDSATRGTAGYALTLLSQWATVLAGEPALASMCALFANEALLALTNATVLAPGIAERREVCVALGVFVRESSGAICDEAAPLLQGLKSLSCQDNADLDFFSNIAHLQPHRRSRALRQLSVLLGSGTKGNDQEREIAEALAIPVLQDLSTLFALPLTYRVALDVSEATEKKVKHAKSMESRDAVRADVVVWASKACGASCRHVPHGEFRVLISRVLRRLPREDNENRLQALYSLLVDIVDSFPTGDDDTGCHPEMADFLIKTILPQMLKHVTAGAVEGDILTTVLAGHTKRGQGGIGSGNAAARTGMVFRAPVAVAAAKLMTRLPPVEMEVGLPLLITPVASALRSRMNDVRESAKKALVRLVVMLGAKYIPYVVQQVLQVLERGYRKDAGVYVIHALLMGIRTARAGSNNENSEMVDDAESGSKLHLPVDAAAGIIADALAAELVEGISANAKDFDNPNVSSSRARDSANRATRAADAAEILGELVSFSMSVKRVVKSFSDAAVSSPSSKLAVRIETALQRLCLGLVRNPSLTPTDALRYAFDTVHSYMPPPGASETPERLEMATETASRVFSTFPRAHLMAEFGLAFLNSALARSVVKADGNDTSSLQMRAMLEPFLAELGFALKSRFDSLTLVALKVTQRLVRLPLAGRKDVADDMTTTVLSVLSRRGVATQQGQASSTKGQDLFRTSLRVASVIVHELGRGGGEGGGGVDSIREESVRQLLVIARECLDTGSSEMRNAALAFIRSVVTARFKTPEIYDAVDDISKLAVRGQSSNLQSSCIAISVSFLVNYPLSAKRIRQQLEFFVRNLNYKHPDGRLAALRALHTVVVKFPVASVNTESEFIFLPLVAVVANDEELSCRREASDAIKALFSRVSDKRKTAEMLEMSTTLLGVTATLGPPTGFDVTNVDDNSVREAGAAVLGVAVRSGVLSKGQIRSVISATLSVALHGCSTDSEQIWEVTHAALCALEQSLEVLEEVGEAAKFEISPELAPLWNAMSSILQHRHSWVRLVACRLLGRHFAALGDDSLAENKYTKCYSICNGPLGTIRDVIKSLCLVLESAVLSEALAEQVLKNLLYVGNCIRLHPAVGEAGLSVTLADGEEFDDLRKVDDITIDNVIAEGSEQAALQCNRGLYWLLRRVSGMATRVGRTDSALLRRACAVRFLAAAVATWGISAVQPYIRLFVGPVVRIVDHKGPLIAGMGSASPEAEAAVAATVAMAEAMQEILVKELGADSYYVIYNDLKAQRRSEQDERKRKFAVETTIDPERAAKKRIKRSAAKSKARRRKASEGGRGQAWRVAHSTHGMDGRESNPLRED